MSQGSKPVTFLVHQHPCYKLFPEVVGTNSCKEPLADDIRNLPSWNLYFFLQLHNFGWFRIYSIQKRN